MNRYWVSWVCTSDDYRPLTFPPNPAILGWWCSGETHDGHMLCAVVKAALRDDAEKAIARDWPEVRGHWRFFDLKEPDFRPGDRFPLSAWMVERFA